MQDAAEDVLAGVLLHTVQPVLHVQHALHGAAGLQGRIGQVGDDPLPGLYVQHIGPAQGAPVGRLAAALGEEGGLVQHHLKPALLFGRGAGQHVGSKAVQVGVVVVQAAGFGMIGLFHGCYLN